MVMCERCEQEMTAEETTTCTAPEPRIRFGAERHDDYAFHGDYPMRCPDCWVELGGIHHVECDKEMCPICGALQRLWCEHRYV